MVAIAGIATVASAGYGIYQTSQNAKNTQSAISDQSAIAQSQFDQNAALQEEYLAYLEGALGEYGAASESIVNQTYQNVSNIISNINIPSVEDLMANAESLSLQDFQFRDDIQKQNLAYIAGDTEPQLREAQSLSASLAALDPAAFQGKMGDIFKSSIYGLKATTVGEPTGSFANLSAANLYNFSQQGLSNYLAISDFFSREGTVDPISPLQTAFDLQSIESNEAFGLAQLGIGNEQWAGTSLLNVESTKLNAAAGIGSTMLSAGSSNVNALANNLIGSSNAGIAANATEQAGYTQAASQLISGLTSYGAVTSMEKSNQVYTDYMNAQINKLNSSSKYV